MTNKLPIRGLGLIAGLFILLAIWASPGLMGSRAVGQSGTDPNSQLQDNAEQKALLQRQMGQLQHSQNLVHDELEDIDRDMANLDTRREHTTSELSRKQAQVDYLNASHAQAMQDLSLSQEKFETRLVEWYKSGAGSVVGSIVTKGTLSDFLYALYYTQAIVESDRNTIDFIKEQQGKIFQQKEQLDKEISDLTEMAETMRSQEAEYRDLHDRRVSKLTEIAGDVNETEAALRQLEASSYEIRSLLQTSHYAGSSGGSSFIRPIQAAITSGFGMRRHPILHSTRMHTGVDMPAPGGTPIHAAQAGVVVFSGWKGGYGYCITIDHGGGLATLYGHCSQLLVSEGETVSRGQVIARVGCTGLATGNHLHFEVRINGDPVDPTPYI